MARVAWRAEVHGVAKEVDTTEQLNSNGTMAGTQGHTHILESSQPEGAYIGDLLSRNTASCVQSDFGSNASFGLY